MKEADPTKKGVPWPVITVVYCLFFPAAVVMMFVKVLNHKVYSYHNGKVMMRFSYLFLLAGVYYPFLIPTVPQALPASFVCIGLGLSIFITGLVYKKKGRRFIQCGQVIKNRGLTSIREIAAAIPTSYDKALKTLEEMLNTGFFTEGSWIDYTAGTLVFPRQSAEPAPRPAAAGTRTVTCPNCGGVSTVPLEGAAKCEYCDSVLP